MSVNPTSIKKLKELKKLSPTPWAEKSQAYGFRRVGLHHLPPNVATMYSEHVPMRNFAPQMPMPELT